MIESVVEDLAVKKALFRELDRIVPPGRPSSPPTPRPCPSSSWPSRPRRPGAGVRRALLQPRAGDGARRDRAAADGRRRHHRDRPGLRHRLRQGAGRGEGPGRLHRERPAVPVPQQRRAHARAGHGVARGHRHRHEGRLQLPDGPVRPARPGRAGHVAQPSWTPSTTSSATRTTPPSRCCGAWCRPAASGARAAGASTTTGSDPPAPVGTGPDGADPIEPPPTRWQLPPADAAEPRRPGGHRGRPRAGDAAGRLPVGPLPDAGRAPPAGLVVARPERRAAARRAPGVEIAATVPAPVRAARRHGVPRRGGGLRRPEPRRAVDQPGHRRRLHRAPPARLGPQRGGVVTRRPARRGPVRRGRARAVRRRVDVQLVDRRLEGGAGRRWCSTCATRGWSCSTSSGRPITWRRSAWWRCRGRGTWSCSATPWRRRRRGHRRGRSPLRPRSGRPRSGRTGLAGSEPGLGD